MPAEWAPHERTIMGWPCRGELWGDQLGQAKVDYAATANAVAAFEPLTMVCADAQDAGEARAALAGEVEVVELPIDDSWLRDSGPIFVLDDEGRRAGVHFGFNSWGEKFTPYDADAAVGRLLIDRLGDRRYDAPFVLEGGSVAVDGEGTLLTTEQCLLHPNRNPDMTREEIEHGLRDFLGVEQVVWLGQGLAEDRDTDGHVDLVAAFTRPGEVLLQSTPLGTPSSERMADNRSRLVAAGLEVVDFPLLPTLEVGGEEVAVGHLNFYLCNGAVIVPVAGLTTDAEALERIGAAYPDREVVGVPGGVIAFGGGGPHCITQQVPAPRAEAS
jgi:agmatine deiminase